jgi:transcriptional regulator with XRE-family HTH domain
MAMSGGVPVAQGAAQRNQTAIGGRLRAVRKQKRLTLHDVEAVSGGEFKASVLGAYERGQRRIAVSRLERLAQIYRVPVDQLLTSAPTVEQRDDGARRGDDIAVIDLTKLDQVQGPERDVLRRYLRFIEIQRQDFNGRVLTIRRDDIRMLGSLFQHSPSGMVNRLDQLGLLLSRG